MNYIDIRGAVQGLFNVNKNICFPSKVVVKGEGNSENFVRGLGGENI